MIQSLFNIQKRISTILIVVGILTLSINTFRGIEREYSIFKLLSNPGIFMLIIFLAFITGTYRLNKPIIRVFHIILFYSNAVISMIYQHDSFYGLGLYILGFLIMYRYRYLESKVKRKIIPLILLLFATIEISAYLKSDEVFGTSINVIIFVVFFLITIYVIYKDEVHNMLSYEKDMNKTVDSLVSEKNKTLLEMEKLQSKVEFLEDEIIKRSNAANIEDYNFTPKERQIVELLCKANLTNQEVASSLFITEGTIKQHMNRIYKKCNVRKRIDIINLFKY